jgi:hypothetical protein
MTYETNKQKIHNYFFNRIYPQIDIFGLDYYKTISTISTELSVSMKIVEDFFKGLFQSEKLKEMRVIELTKKELENRTNKSQEAEKEVEAVIKGEPIETIEVKNDK